MSKASIARKNKYNRIFKAYPVGERKHLYLDLMSERYISIQTARSFWEKFNEAMRKALNTPNPEVDNFFEDCK
jgi:hypothetical protein